MIAQSKGRIGEELVNSIDKIDPQPDLISFKNSFPVNNEGGHLQGIQQIRFKGIDYYFLSGSSDSFSYFSVVKGNKRGEVISINKILDKPFKHAGGFQISNGFMAVGIEDNSLKDKSKVFIYEIDNPEKLPENPVKVINRAGTVKRATAGCVGIIEIDGQILVVVGDWDTKHLDFYKIKKDYLNDENYFFELMHSVDVERINKIDWVDEEWLSYQNINLIKDSSGNLFLVGLATNKNGEDVLDLYSLNSKEISEFRLTKIYSRSLKKNNATRFQWGAGIYSSKKNKIKILSCGAHIEEVGHINIYD